MQTNHKTECNIAKDLIKQYETGDISEESYDFIQEHICNCAECNQIFESANNRKNNRKDTFTVMAAKAGKKRRIVSRAFVIGLIVILLLTVNFISALQNGIPLFTLYSQSHGSSTGSGYSQIHSIGFTIYKYDTNYADYTEIKPWFVSPEMPETLTYQQYDNLMSQLSQKTSPKESSPESAYFDTEFFSQCHIFKIERADNTMKLYAWCADGEFAIYDGQAYQISGSSMPIIMTAQLSKDDIQLTEIWRPADGDRYTDSIKESFPSELYAKTFENTPSQDALEKLNQAAAIGLGVPVSENLLILDTESGYLEITRSWDNYDANGQYHYQTEVIKSEVLHEK